MLGCFTFETPHIFRFQDFVFIRNTMKWGTKWSCLIRSAMPKLILHFLVSSNMRLHKKPNLTTPYSSRNIYIYIYIFFFSQKNLTLMVFKTAVSSFGIWTGVEKRSEKETRKIIDDDEDLFFNTRLHKRERRILDYEKRPGRIISKLFWSF